MRLELGRSGIVAVTTNRGTFTRRVDAALGHPANPLPYDRLVLKFLDYASYASREIPPDRLDRVVDLIDHIETVDDASVIPSLLSGGAE